jgi:hypothetical protein
MALNQDDVREALARVLYETLRDMDVGIHYRHHSEQGEWETMRPDAWRSPFLKSADAILAYLAGPLAIAQIRHMDFDCIAQRSERRTHGA